MGMDREVYYKWVECRDILINGSGTVRRELNGSTCNDFVKWSREHNDVLEGLVVADDSLIDYFDVYDEYRKVIDHLDKVDRGSDEPLLYLGGGMWKRFKSSKNGGGVT